MVSIDRYYRRICMAIVLIVSLIIIITVIRGETIVLNALETMLL